MMSKKKFGGQHCTSIYFERTDRGLMRFLYGFIPAAISPDLSKSAYLRQLFKEDLRKRGILREDGSLDEKRVRSMLKVIKERNIWDTKKLSAAREWKPSKIQEFEEWLENYLEEENDERREES
jgi:hypothetical protein